MRSYFKKFYVSIFNATSKTALLSIKYHSNFQKQYLFAKYFETINTFVTENVQNIVLKYILLLLNIFKILCDSICFCRWKCAKKFQNALSLWIFDNNKKINAYSDLFFTTKFHHNQKICRLKYSYYWLSVAANLTAVFNSLMLTMIKIFLGIS